MSNLKAIAKKLQIVAANLKEAADEIYQIPDQNNPSDWVDKDVEKVQKDTDTISISEKEVPIKKAGKKMIATKEDRIKIAADLNRIADKMDEIEEKEEKISSKRANELKHQCKAGLNHIADEVERLGLDESITDDDDNDDEEIKAGKKMIATKEDRIKIAADLNRIADKMDEIEEKEKDGKVSSERANELKHQCKASLNHIADEVERLGLDESIVDDEGEEFDDDIDVGEEIEEDDEIENLI